MLVIFIYKGKNMVVGVLEFEFVVIYFFWIINCFIWDCSILKLMLENCVDIIVIIVCKFEWRWEKSIILCMWL